jgi:hypothetical protein
MTLQAAVGAILESYLAPTGISGAINNLAPLLGGLVLLALFTRIWRMASQ